MQAPPLETSQALATALRQYYAHVAQEGGQEKVDADDAFGHTCARDNPMYYVEYLVCTGCASAKHVLVSAEAILLEVQRHVLLTDGQRDTLPYQAVLHAIRCIGSIRDEALAGGRGLACRFNDAVMRLAEDLAEAMVVAVISNAATVAESARSLVHTIDVLKATYRDRRDAATLDSIRLCKGELVGVELKLRIADETAACLTEQLEEFAKMRARRGGDSDGAREVRARCCALSP